MDPEENKQTEPTNEPEPTTEPEDSDSNQAEPIGDDGTQEESLKDQHGQDAISKGKYQRDIAAKDAKIAELEALVSEASKTEEGRQELLGKIEEIKRESEVSKVEYELKLAGCRDDKATKAAMALLPDYAERGPVFRTSFNLSRRSPTCSLQLSRVPKHTQPYRAISRGVLKYLRQ